MSKLRKLWRWLNTTPDGEQPSWEEMGQQSPSKSLSPSASQSPSCGVSPSTRRETRKP